LRALAIPSLAAKGQDPSIITNAVSFREFTKANLALRGKAGAVQPPYQIQLTQRLFATGAFSQFFYKTLNPQNNPSTQGTCDPIWDT
jgi:hypothetical protein